jgi:predicted GTPase
MGKLKQELKEALSQLKPPSIAVIGRTGAGKSTLINAVFGNKLAAVGAGLPVSKNFEKYPKSSDENVPVIIYDSKGYELGEDSFIQGVLSFLEERHLEGIDNQIHLIWYLIPASTKRFLPFDAEIIGKFKNQRVPIIIVISQVDIVRPAELKSMEDTINSYKSEHGLTQIQCVQVAADPIREGEEPFGVKELVDQTIELLPKLYTEAFVVRQIANLEVKRKRAIKYIKLNAASCFAVAFVPIPFTTPAAAIGSQAVLVKQIAALYGYMEVVEILDSVGSLTFSSIVTYIGTSILDFMGLLTIQFGGSIVLGMAAGAAAATYIAVVGLAYISVFEKLTKEDLSGPGKEKIDELVQKIFKEEFKRLSSNVKITSEQDLDNLEHFLE